MQFITSSADSAYTFSSKTQTSVPGHTIEINAQGSQPKSYSDIGFSYSAGGKVKSGFRICYNMLKQKDSSSSLLGFGYNLEVLKVMNKESMIEGTIVTFGGNFALRQLLSEENTSAYFGLQGTLTFGSESIDYGSHKESSFYFGPLIRETLGVSFDKKVYLEAGVYEILLIGSKMLPNDIGFTIGVSFGI
jgi:hypothetical protein